MKAFKPLTSHGFNFKHRIAMPGMTRCRADPKNGKPNDLVKEYYQQRAASACMIVTESMPINNSCNPWPGSASINTKDNIDAWKSITEAVHKENCYMFAQLFHGGRLVHPDLNNGNLPLAPSPIAIKGETFVINQMKPYPKPVEMTQKNIDEVIKDHITNVKFANEAGFDGIEINAGPGILIDQFIKPHSNHRTDKYGGSVENRCRFLLELLDEVLGVISPKKVGLKIAFVGRGFDSYDDDPWSTLKYVIPQLKKRGILYLNVVESEDYIKENNGALQMENTAKEVRKYWDGLLLTNGFRPIEERFRKIEEGEADIVTFARNFISNPDLTERLKNNWPLAPVESKYNYTGGAKGYVDYPKYTPSQKQ